MKLGINKIKSIAKQVSRMERLIGIVFYRSSPSSAFLLYNQTISLSPDTVRSVYRFPLLDLFQHSSICLIWHPLAYFALINDLKYLNKVR